MRVKVTCLTNEFRKLTDLINILHGLKVHKANQLLDTTNRWAKDSIPWPRNYDCIIPCPDTVVTGCFFYLIHRRCALVKQ